MNRTEEFQARLEELPGRVVRFPREYRPVEGHEQPVGKAQIAGMFGVSIRTVDRWVERDHMPKDTRHRRGCWLQAGAHRRYYPSRVREWLDER